MRCIFVSLFVFVYILVIAPKLTIALSSCQPKLPTRRQVVKSVFGVSFLALIPTSEANAAPSSEFVSLLDKVKEAKDQLAVVPKLIEEGKWDAVRAVLIEPPLSDCWAKTGRPLLPKYAEALGDAGGDELAALEAKEEAISHLRYLDMAVYNNVFNPIATEGKTGASERLIRSYYEDPINEFKASAEALEELVNLSKDL